MADEQLSMSQQFSGLPMEDLIGGPLNAVAKANASMSSVQAKFILDTCFTVEQGVRIPVMVKMILSRASVDDTESQDMVFQVPLISLLPIYPLGVDVEMNPHQKIPCPVCGTPIPFEINRMLRGEVFSCPRCDAKISLSSECCPQVHEAIDKLNKLK